MTDRIPTVADVKVARLPVITLMFPMEPAVCIKCSQCRLTFYIALSILWFALKSN
jgi:hypothetical protein